MAAAGLTEPPTTRPVKAVQVPATSMGKVFQAAQDWARSTGNEVVKLHVGDPFFGPPAAAVEALSEAAHRGDTRYSAVEGVLELREALVEKLAVRNGVDATPSRVFVTPGSTQGLTALLRSITEPGADILLPELHWPVLVQQALLAGLRPNFYRLGPGYRLDPEDVLAAATPRTKVLLLNSPANPTGVVLDPDTVSRLLSHARELGWQVISDEAYEHYVYDGEFCSTASFERDVPVAERIVHSVFSFSKSAAMTGFRLGYVATANEATAASMRVVQEAGILSPPTPTQYAGLAALRSHDSILHNRELVRRNRDSALPPLVEHGLLDELPMGGWYAVLDVAKTGMDADTFASRLLDRSGVAVVPAAGCALQPAYTDTGDLESVGTAPWARSLIRIAFCGEPAGLARGVEEIVALASAGGA